MSIKLGLTSPKLTTSLLTSCSVLLTCSCCFVVSFLFNSGIKDKNFMLHYEVSVILSQLCMICVRASGLAFKGEIGPFQGC